jgi:putative membrane protein
MIGVYLTGLWAAFMHLVFFLLESVAWGGPAANRVFRVSREAANEPMLRGFAFNMGFYNLFLSLGTLAALRHLHQGTPGAQCLLQYCCLFMIGAGVVLLASGGMSRLRGALLQAGPPALCLALLQFTH